MNLKDIKNFVFINPSPVLFKISNYIKDKGFNVKLTNVDFIGVSNPRKLNYFVNDDVFSIKVQSSSILKTSLIKKSFSFKKPFFNISGSKKNVDLDKFFNISVKGNISDAQFLSINSLSENLEIDSETFKSYDDLFSVYDNSLFVSSWYYSSSMKKINGRKFNVSVYETDFDIYSVFNREYFVILDGKNRIEIFIFKNKLYLVSDFTEDSLGALFKKFEFLKKFKFEREKSFDVFRNTNHYVNVSKNIVLMNDYSFFNVSVNLPDSWIEAAGAYLCSGKL